MKQPRRLIRYCFLFFTVISCKTKNKEIQSLSFKHDDHDKGLGYIFLFRGFEGTGSDIFDIFKYAKNRKDNSIRSMIFVISDSGFSDDIDFINENEKELLCTLEWDTLGIPKNKFVAFGANKYPELSPCGTTHFDFRRDSVVSSIDYDVHKFYFSDNPNISLCMIDYMLKYIAENFIEKKEIDSVGSVKTVRKTFSKVQIFKFFTKNHLEILEITYEKDGLHFDISPVCP